MEITKQYLNDLTYSFLGCCINVHKELGPGLLERVYHQCLIEELKYEEISSSSELKAPKGILVNFNCLNIFKEGQKTFVNDFFSELPAK